MFICQIYLVVQMRTFLSRRSKGVQSLMVWSKYIWWKNSGIAPNIADSLTVVNSRWWWIYVSCIMLSCVHSFTTGMFTVYLLDATLQLIKIYFPWFALLQYSTGLSSITEYGVSEIKTEIFIYELDLYIKNAIHKNKTIDSYNS